MPAGYRIVHLAYGDDPLQFGDLYLPEEKKEPYPVVILIHGGFWRAAYGLSLMVGLAKDLARRGIAAWNIEYRRVGDAGGGWPGTLLDVALATDYLRMVADICALDLERVVPIGHSAGGHLALWLGARRQIPKESPLSLFGCHTPLALKGIIGLAGVMDLEYAWRLRLGNDAVAELLGGSPDEKRKRYTAASPVTYLPLGIPQVLIHGSADSNVPLAVSQVYADKARHAGDTITLIELPGANHFVIIDPTSQAWTHANNEIDKLLFPL